MTPQSERFTAKTTVLIENVRHHMDEEDRSRSRRCETA